MRRTRLAACGGGGDGVMGTSGTSGAAGAPGAVGAPGTPGAAGNNLASRSAAAPVGVNCPAGGLHIQTGIDISGNGVLELGEVQSTSYVRKAAAAATRKAWGTAELIETSNAGNARDAQVAMDASGNAFTVWSQSDGTRTNIWANRYTPATGWGGLALIETDNAGDVGDPQIVMDTGGNAFAVWQKSIDTRINVLSNRYTGGTGWGTANPIETDNAGNASFP